MRDLLPRHFRLLTLAVPASVLGLSLLRIAFWLAFSDPADPLGRGDLLRALYLGMKYDLRLVLTAFLPLLLLGGIPALDPFRRPGARGFWLAYLGIAAAAILLVYVFDFGHYAYLGQRLDANAVQLLKDPDISMRMVWETYPVIRVAGGLVFALAALTWVARRAMIGIAAQSSSRSGLARRGPVVAVGAVLVLAGLYGKVSWYPLRWSDAFFGPHPFAATVASNPVLYLADTFRYGGGARVDPDRLRAHYADIADWLGVQDPDPETLEFRRWIEPAPAPVERPNVVIVLLESFAGFQTGLAGNPLDPSPHVDELGRNGLYFPNFFIPQSGTARSVFCLLTGIPDVETNDTSSRNPRAVHQHTLLTAFEGYEHLYLLGGSASWGNIRGLLSRNVPDLRIYEEGSYSAPRVDVWGISDLDLFRAAHRLFGGGSRPFVAVVQTSGNHAPFTIPADSAGFLRRDEDPDLLRRHGFAGERQFNAFRFMDHSVGEFMRLARSAPYFERTLFVFLGDHGLSRAAGEHVPPGETLLGLNVNRVPLVIYGPRWFPSPRVVTEPAGQADVLPTVLALAGVPHLNTTLGRDLLDPRFDGTRSAFRITQGAPLRVGLIGDEFLYEEDADGGRPRLHRLGGDDPRHDVAAEHPETAEAMARLTRGLHEAARHLLTGNPPHPHRPPNPEPK